MFAPLVAKTQSGTAASAHGKPAPWKPTSLDYRPSDGGRQPRLPGPIQAKLEVGSVNDPLEGEADRVADQVMRMPAPEISSAAPPQISRKYAACEGEEGKLRKKPDGYTEHGLSNTPASVHEALRSPGQPLDAQTRAYFEPRFGTDLTGVRVHTGTLSNQSAAQLGARAYTRGMDVIYASGECPGANRLTAHELTHVVQGAFASEPLSIRRAPGDTPSPANPPYSIVSPVWEVEDAKGIRRLVLVVEHNGEVQAMYQRSGDSPRDEGHGGPQAGEWAPFLGFVGTRFEKDIYHAGKDPRSPLHGYGDEELRDVAKWLDGQSSQGKLPKAQRSDPSAVQRQLQNLGVDVHTPIENLTPANPEGELNIQEGGVPRGGPGGDVQRGSSPRVRMPPKAGATSARNIEAVLPEVKQANIDRVVAGPNSGGGGRTLAPVTPRAQGAHGEVVPGAPGGRTVSGGGGGTLAPVTPRAQGAHGEVVPGAPGGRTVSGGGGTLAPASPQAEVTSRAGQTEVAQGGPRMVSGGAALGKSIAGGLLLALIDMATTYIIQKKIIDPINRDLIENTLKAKENEITKKLQDEKDFILNIQSAGGPVYLNTSFLMVFLTNDDGPLRGLTVLQRMTLQTVDLSDGYKAGIENVDESFAKAAAEQALLGMTKEVALFSQALLLHPDLIAQNIVRIDRRLTEVNLLRTSVVITETYRDQLGREQLLLHTCRDTLLNEKKFHSLDSLPWRCSDLLQQLKGAYN